MDYRPVFYIVGIFLCVLAVSMIIPIAVDVYDNNRDWVAFTYGMGLTLFAGITLLLANKQEKIDFGGRQAFVLTALSWMALSLFSAIPLWFAVPSISVTDAIFESVSGLTTTGSTILTGLDNAPRGILIWRGLLQWLGGIGIIVMAISILPFLKVGGMQLFRLESSEKEKAMPSVTDMTKGLFIAYTVLTIACGLCYYYAGMTQFDAVVHAMTTIATGGFSTLDSSFANFSELAKIFSIFFMVIACFPFVIFIKMYVSSILDVFRDEQIMAFLKIQAVVWALILFYMYDSGAQMEHANIVEYIFNVVSVSTGTGYASGDYTLWGPFAIGLIFFISCFGGCAGSASCGIKIFRIQILASVAKNQILQLIYPNGVFTISYRDEPLSVQIAASVMGFFFIYMTSIMVITLLLLFTGLDFMTALSGCMTAISNVGPGLGDIIGPAGTFQPLPDISKWILIAAMILGRLEFFTLLVLLSPRFWKR